MQYKEHPGPTVNDHENDFLWGTRAISRAINRTERQTYHLLARGNIKSAQKKGATWVAHRQTLRREFGA